MGISVEGQKCPVCGAYVFDNDDLVFCPECGAPHHRECYEALGHCAYEDKHGTDEQYNPEAEKEKTEKKGNLFGDEPPFEENTIPCRFCGEPLSKNERVCHNCRRPQTPAGSGVPPFGAGPAFMFDPLGGVAPDEMIGDVTAKEIKDYVAVNTQRYVPRFKAIKKEKKKSWNWAGFLLPETWLFYRKMYFPGILVTILLVISTLFSLPFYDYLKTLPEEAKTAPMILFRYMLGDMDFIAKQPFFWMMIGSMLIDIGIRIACGFMGDRIYLKTVTEGIKNVKAAENELEIPIETALARKGSVNVFLGIVCLFGREILISIVQLIYISFV